MTDRFNLTVARIEAGYSKRSLADELGISRGTLATLESGGTVHPANAKKVADKFGVLVTDLMPVAKEAA